LPGWLPLDVFAPKASSPARRIRGFEFHKRSQFFIGTHDETLSVVALCVSNWQFTIKTNLKQSEDLEDDHDNDNYSNYVEDASVHTCDFYQSECVACETILPLLLSTQQ
jgi:hypothetical protein